MFGRDFGTGPDQAFIDIITRRGAQFPSSRQSLLLQDEFTSKTIFTRSQTISIHLNIKSNFESLDAILFRSTCDSSPSIQKLIVIQLENRFLQFYRIIISFHSANHGFMIQKLFTI